MDLDPVEKESREKMLSGRCNFSEADYLMTKLHIRFTPLWCCGATRFLFPNSSSDWLHLS